MNAATNNRCALLTPAGSGAIAVIQISGPRANEILRACFTSTQAIAFSSESGKLTYGKIVDGYETIDDVIVGINASAHSPSAHVYTHGGVRVVERVIEVLEKLGARLIEKTSTRDTWQADNEIEHEAFEALVHARTERAVRFLCHQRQRLAQTVSHVIRLAEQSIPAAITELQRLVDSFDTVQRLLHGAIVVLFGKPNAGKSTLFNRLVGRDAAVVTPIPGTTRDWVSESIEIRGIPITLIDTAGQRETVDQLEQVAISAGADVHDRADLCIEVIDANNDLLSPVSRMQEAKSPTPKHIIVLSKIDLLDRARANVEKVIEWRSNAVQVSARDGTGLNDLASAIESKCGFSDLLDSQSHLFTARQAHLARMILSDPGLAKDRITLFLREIIGERSVDPRSAGI